MEVNSDIHKFVIVSTSYLHCYILFEIHFYFLNANFVNGFLRKKKLKWKMLKMKI